MRFRHINELIGSSKRGKLILLTPEQAARLRAQPEPHKLPASEYTRMILAAKDGEISPGEAERRLRKYGANLRIMPLPRPPGK